MTIPLSVLFADESFYRHLELERRSNHKNQRLLDAIDKELCAIALKQAQKSKHHKDESKAAGEKSGRIRKEDRRARNNLILAAEKKLIEAGENPRNITQKLFARYGKQFELGKKQIYRIRQIKKTPTLVDVPLILKNVLTETNPKGDKQ